MPARHDTAKQPEPPPGSYPGRALRALRKAAMWAAIAVLADVGLTRGYLLMARASGFGEFAMRALERCEAVRERLGNSPRVALFGLIWGSSEVAQGRFGFANWRVPVKGSRGSGTYTYALELHGGSWEMTAGNLSAGGEEVDVLRCAVRRS